METNTSSAAEVDVLERWVDEGRSLLAALDPIAGVADDTLLTVIAQACRARDAVDAVLAACVGEAHARGTTDLVAGLSTARWLSSRCAMTRRNASRLARVANTVRRDLPATAAALASINGWFSFDHATVMADAINPRIVTEFQIMEPELVALAETMVFEQWRTHVRITAAYLDHDGAYDPNADVLNNRLSLVPGPDGTVLKGALVGDSAVMVDQALDTVLSELIEQYRTDAAVTGCEVPGLLTLRALALAELCRRALGVRSGDTGPGHVEATLVVHADDLDTAYDTHDIAHRRTALGSMLCDAEVITVILDSLGVPIDMGRHLRLYNRAQRRALGRRDGGCVFPGCDTPAHRCHAHHIDHWHLGGHTNLDRGVLLCPHHHSVVHRTGWDIDLTPDAKAIFTTPDGTRLWGQRHHQHHTGPLPPPSPASVRRRTPTATTPDQRIAAARHHLDRHRTRRRAPDHRAA